MTERGAYIEKPITEPANWMVLLLSALMFANGYLLAIRLQPDPEPCTYKRIGGMIYPSSSQCVEGK